MKCICNINYFAKPSKLELSCMGKKINMLSSLCVNETIHQQHLHTRNGPTGAQFAQGR